MEGHLGHQTFIAFDLETTGLSSRRDRIVEIGALAFDDAGSVLDSFQTCLNPECRMPPAAQAVHGLSDDMLRTAPRAAAVLPVFVEWLDRLAPAALVAHNASFDAGFLSCELQRASLSAPRTSGFVVDTLPLARRLWPRLDNHRLDTVARALGLSTQTAHRALEDSSRVMGVWLAAIGEVMRCERSMPKPSPLAALEPLVRYGISSNSSEDNPALKGFEWLSEAIENARTICLEYGGGSRGQAPRRVTPLSVERRAGTSYLVAICHVDRIEKSFRFDRILRAAVVESGTGSP
jgi:DNA polymerase III epsilon subunit family exonuclease